MGTAVRVGGEVVQGVVDGVDDGVGHDPRPQDLGMVERQTLVQGSLDRHPVGGGRVVAGDRLPPGGGPRQIGPAGVPAARVAAGGGVDADQAQLDDVEAGLLRQLPAGGVLGGLAGVDVAAGKCPHPGVGRPAAADQQHVEDAVAFGQGDDVGGQPRGLVGVGHLDASRL